MAEHPADPSTRMDALARWLDATRPIGMKHFRTALTVESKLDGSPVTVADRSIERSLADSIRSAFPDDGILGEEHGEHRGSSPWRWLLDPIDGTASFVRGMPLWGTLVGLEHHDASGCGPWSPGSRTSRHSTNGSLRPPRRWRWVSPTGTVRCRTSSCTDLRLALVCTTSTEYFRRAGCLDAWGRLGLAAESVRGWSDCSALLLLATGRIDAVVEPVMHPWDIGPFAAILPAAGACWSTLDGRTHHLAGSMVAAATPPLHGAILAALQAPQP